VVVLRVLREVGGGLRRVVGGRGGWRRRLAVRLRGRGRGRRVRSRGRGRVGRVGRGLGCRCCWRVLGVRVLARVGWCCGGGWPLCCSPERELELERALRGCCHGAPSVEWACPRR